MFTKKDNSLAQSRTWREKKAILVISSTCLLVNTFAFAGNWNVPIAAQDLKNPTTSTKESRVIGQKIYEEHCINCHGKVGLGDGEEQTVEYSLQSVLLTLVEPGNTPISDGELYWKITHGVAKMPSFAGVLTDEERWIMVNHLRHLPKEPK